MPYYVFRVLPLARLERLAEFPAFTYASRHAKALRAAQAADAAGQVRVIFAETPEQAEDLLCQIRDPQPAGDD